MDNVYILSDSDIFTKIGSTLKSNRLRQNITQQSLSESSGVPLSTLKRIERGEIGSFESLLRVLRVLGMLQIIEPLVEEEQLSPQEYYELMSKVQGSKRKRAAGRLNVRKEGTSEW